MRAISRARAATMSLVTVPIPLKWSEIFPWLGRDFFIIQIRPGKAGNQPEIFPNIFRVCITYFCVAVSGSQS